MAEGLLFNFIEKLIMKLGSMAVESWNMRDDVVKLVRNMSEIKAVVVDAEEQKATNHEVQVWVGTLKDALEDAENLLDDISTEDLRREVITRGKKAKKVRIFFSKSNQLLFSSKVASRVKELGKIIEALNVGRRGFSFTSRTFEQRVIEFMKQRETGSFIREEAVIGREEEKKQIVQLLLETNMDLKENVSIISIVGIGGLGKTALAQLVYNDEAVKHHFRELQKWVCVADELSAFDVKEVAMKITGIKPSDEPDMDRVQQALREKIKGKRYLLVLDDVWNGIRHLWLELLTLLKEGAKGSKIIITTRSEEVSEICGTSSPLLLKGLNEEQSWKLFTQLAFKDGKEPENHNMVLIGKEIVKKCSGVPLAIRIVGSLMYSKATDSDWKIFKDRDLVKLDEQGGNIIFQILKLSYDHLPFNLKKCFAFCSLFPKDYEIRKEQLIRLWVAHGFVESWDERMCIEDVGNEYFINLSQRSFFQDFERHPVSDDILKCKMHDLVHDLAKLVSTNDCVTVTSKEQQIDRGTRHLSFNFKVDSSWQVPSSLLKANKLRTFLNVRFGYGQALEGSACSSIISSLQQVRILDLRDFNCKMLPSCIGQLVHLRYLDLSWNPLIEVLPPSITELYNLQTLLLTGCSELKELPRDLWKLVNLRHLDLHGCDALTCMPRGMGQLTNLQTLTQFVLDTTSKCKQSSEPNELEGLNSLRVYIEIKGLEWLRRNPSKAKDFNLKGKSSLLGLRLRWGDDERYEEGRDKDNVILEALLSAPNIKSLRIYGFGGDAISDSVPSFTNLLNVSIWKCTRLQYLPPLHLWLHLKSLSLWDLPCIECIYNIGSSNDSSSIFFPSLNEIELVDLPNLKEWCRCSEESCQHRLKGLDSLRIEYCPNLISVPQHSYIKDVRLGAVNEKILERVVKNSQVSSLRIQNINGLRSLSRILQHLVAVSSLEISSCEELDPCNDEDGYYAMQWTQLSNLLHLVFRNIPKMESSPDGLQHLTSLESLSIWDCANLKCIPEWVTSLQRHEIGECPNLTSIPEGVNVQQSQT